MKKYVYPAMSIIFLVAIISYLASAGYGMGIILLISFALLIMCAYLIKQCKVPKDNIIVEEQTQQTLQDLINTYGTPDEIIVTDVTRGNEIDGAVLVYNMGGRHGKGFLVCNGAEIDKENITDITFHNKYGTAFGLPDEFHVVVSTNDERQPKFYIRAGNDLEMVKDIVAQMKSLI